MLQLGIEEHASKQSAIDMAQAAFESETVVRVMRARRLVMVFELVHYPREVRLYCWCLVCGNKALRAKLHRCYTAVTYAKHRINGVISCATRTGCFT